MLRLNFIFRGKFLWLNEIKVVFLCLLSLSNSFNLNLLSNFNLLFSILLNILSLLFLLSSLFSQCLLSKLLLNFLSFFMFLLLGRFISDKHHSELLLGFIIFLLFFLGLLHQSVIDWCQLLLVEQTFLLNLLLLFRLINEVIRSITLFIVLYWITKIKL